MPVFMASAASIYQKSGINDVGRPRPNLHIRKTARRFGGQRDLQFPLRSRRRIRRSVVHRVSAAQVMNGLLKRLARYAGHDGRATGLVDDRVGIRSRASQYQFAQHRVRLPQIANRIGGCSGTGLVRHHQNPSLALRSWFTAEPQSRIVGGRFELRAAAGSECDHSQYDRIVYRLKIGTEREDFLCAGIKNHDVDAVAFAQFIKAKLRRAHHGQYFSPHTACQVEHENKVEWFLFKTEVDQLLIVTFIENPEVGFSQTRNQVACRIHCLGIHPDERNSGAEHRVALSPCDSGGHDEQEKSFHELLSYFSATLALISNRMGYRGISITALAALFALRAACAATAPDPAFQGVPFDRWAAEGHHEQIRWNVEVPAAELSSHQRLLLTVRVQLNLHELARRKGKSNLVLLAQLRDQGGAVWRTHGALKTADYQQTAFVLPGDYELSLAAFDPDTDEYSFVRKKVHVAALRTDPLTGSWEGLPRVEWIPADTEGPDAWFLPAIESRMNLPVPTLRPVHLDVILNVTPAGKASGSLTELRRNMDVLIPALKVVSQLNLRDGSMDVSLLDLVHQKVAFAQDKVQNLNWGALKTFFAGFNPGVIDVAALENSWKMRGFFEDEVKRTIEAARHNAPGDGHAVIVLSGPAFFDSSTAEEAPEIEKNADGKIFYIRYRSIAPEALAPRRRVRPGMRLPPPMPRPVFFFAMPLDDLEKPLQPLNSRIFDVISAEQFRRVLAAVIDQIGKL